jgi:D-amino-acid oxidase
MPGSNLHRRKFLKSALGIGAFALANGSLSRLRATEAEVPRRRFAPLKISADRLIRTVVGLRPYRSEGFVVRAERFGEKTVIHNYGHGGAGVTLSWGTSGLAANLAFETGKKEFAVIGCGVMGLSTARILQRRGGNVTIYARDQPPATTSNVAGALWYPTSSFNPEKVAAGFLEEFQRVCRESNRAFQELVGADYGVRWIETFLLRKEPPKNAELIGGAGLYPATTILQGQVANYGYPHVTQFSTMLIEPAVYLRALLRDFYLAGGKVVGREFQNRDELMALHEPVVMNCTGLGARILFGDEGLIPVRGQLEVLLPQPEIDYCYIQESIYMFPRSDGIILGGTFDHDWWSLEPDATQTAATLEANTRIAHGLG